jgi:hypothetical protein
MKLSWPHHPWIKALWYVEIMMFNVFAHRLANILVINFTKLCIKLIGQKSAAVDEWKIFKQAQVRSFPRTLVPQFSPSKLKLKRGYTSTTIMTMDKEGSSSATRVRFHRCGGGYSLIWQWSSEINQNQSKKVDSRLFVQVLKGASMNQDQGKEDFHEGFENWFEETVILDGDSHYQAKFCQQGEGAHGAVAKSTGWKCSRPGFEP